jgi:hypothetical protein
MYFLAARLIVRSNLFGGFVTEGMRAAALFQCSVGYISDRTLECSLRPDLARYGSPA